MRAKSGGDAERRPQQQIAPLVLHQLEPVGELQEVLHLDVGGEVRLVVGQHAGVEDVLVGHLLPAAVDQVVPGQPAEHGGRHARPSGGARSSLASVLASAPGRGHAGRRLVVGLLLRRARRIGRRALEEELVVVVLQDLLQLGRVDLDAGIVDRVERHRLGVGVELGDLFRREAAALEQHGRGREVGRCDVEILGDVGAFDVARRGHHGGVELQHRLGRLFLVPQRDRQDAAGLQRPHVGAHRLARIGVLLDDGEAAGARQAGRIGQRQVDDVVAVLGMGDVEAAVIVDDGDLGVVEDVAGEIAQALVLAERRQDRGIALGDRDMGRARLQRHRRRDAAAELDDEGVGVLLQDVRVVHRQVLEIRRLAGRQVLDDARRALGVDVEAEIGVLRHGRQVERGVVRLARREMQVRARIDLQVAERRGPLVGALVVGELAGVGHALVVRHGELGDAQHRRRHVVHGGRQDGDDDDGADAAPVAERHEPQHAARQPEQQRRHDEVVGPEEVHGEQHGEPAQARAHEIGEVDAVEGLLRLQEDDAEIERARQERQEIEHEVGEQAPLLHRVGDQEDGVERHLLGGEVAHHHQRPEGQQRALDRRPASGARTSPCRRT